MTTIFGALGVSPTLRGQPTNVISLVPGQVELIPAGTWRVSTGLYTFVQEYDPVTTIWRNIDPTATDKGYINSDGVNYRVANLTGCVVGANITNAGTGYTSAPTVTDNGGSTVLNTYVPIIGGALNTTVTILNGGKNYTYAPQLFIQAPNAPGIQATATCTVSSGAISTVTIVNQGAGYAFVPTVTVQNDPRDTTGTGGVLTVALTGSQTLTGLLVNPGSPITSGAVPTISFAGGGGSSAAATAIMCWTTTAYTVTSAGSGYAGNVLVLGYSSYGTTAGSYTNPTTQSALVRQRPAVYAAAVSSAAITTAGSTLIDGGIFPNIPIGYVAGYANNGSAAQVSFTVGSVADTVVILAV